MVLVTVAALWIVLCGSTLVLVMAQTLSSSLVAVHIGMGQVGTTCVAPVFPLSRWSIGVSLSSSAVVAAVTPVGGTVALLVPVLLLLHELLEHAFDLVKALVCGTIG